MPRLGISVLSKDNVSVAYEEEVMCNKRTGEFLVKTTDGDSMSYQYFSRLRSHEYNAEKLARDYGLVTRAGHDVNIYSISADTTVDNTTVNLVLPDTVLLDTNYIITPIEMTGIVERFIISVDLDSVIVESGNVAKDLFDGINATVVMKAYQTSGDTDTLLETVTLTAPLSTIGSKLNEFSTSTITDATYMSLEQITFTRDASADTIRTVLHSMMIVVETVNTD